MRFDARVPAYDNSSVPVDMWNRWHAMKARVFGMDEHKMSWAIIWSVRPDQVLVRFARGMDQEPVYLGDPISEFPSEDLRRRMMILL